MRLNIVRLELVGSLKKKKIYIEFNKIGWLYNAKRIV